MLITKVSNSTWSISAIFQLIIYFFQTSTQSQHKVSLCQKWKVYIHNLLSTTQQPGISVFSLQQYCLSKVKRGEWVGGIFVCSRVYPPNQRECANNISLSVYLSVSVIYYSVNWISYLFLLLSHMFVSLNPLCMA